jgi:CRISPR-associated endonuclease/helicase Cas3
MADFYAHSLPGRPFGEWERLEDHLRRVADQAGEFAAAFDARDWGRLAGLWHDLGKLLPEFQERLRGSPVRVDHAGPGAVAALTLGNAAIGLALAIAGHHAGLANIQARGETTITPLLDRLADNAAAWQRLQAAVPLTIFPQSLPATPPVLSARNDAEKRRLELWIRFLFSALVDADYLQTERFYDPAIAEHRRRYDSVGVLCDRLNAHLAKFRTDTPVNRLRAEVLVDCRRAAALPPGLFSLTVPTGGGKTLSGIAFALDHALRHGQRRVVVAIPYTSIIEQTAAVYRGIFVEANVLEHHSNIDVQSRREQNEELESRRRLAAQNWDAPIVVTTNVQLIESLLSNQPSRCRKLHNLARSVIVLDEAQCLPIDMTAALVDLLNEIATSYGASVVLSTATQPALKDRESFPGLIDVREIVADPPALAARLRRVRVHWPDLSQPRPASYERIAAAVAGHPRVLAIVHLRRDARNLAKLLPTQGRFHLSALMCPAHRRAVLDEVRRRLKDDDLSLRLVATQLVEAGVDVDFPVVFRALAGLDSIAQAAGRCDREGHLTEAAGCPAGEVVVFRAPTDPPSGVLRQGEQTTLGMLAENGGALDIGDPAIFENYFRRLYLKHPLDRGLQTHRAQLNFATVAEMSNVIEDGYSVPIVVPYGDAAARLERYRHQPDRETLAALQPYFVQATLQDVARLQSLGGIEPLNENGTAHVLTPLCAHLYDAKEFGLVVGDDSLRMSRP